MKENDGGVQRKKYVSGVGIGDGGNDKKVFWKTTWDGVLCRWMFLFLVLIPGVVVGDGRTDCYFLVACRF